MRRNGYIVLLVAALAWIGCGASHRPPGAEPLLESASVAAAARNPVTVSPLPGTPDASPSTQISFLGPPGTRVSSVRVVGSRSGAHPGTLRSYSTGTGASFIPDRPFAQGEHVTVRARVAGGPRAARTR